MTEENHDRVAETASPSEAFSADPRTPGLSPLADPYSAMTPRFNFFFRWFAKRYLRHFDLGDEAAGRLRELEKRGSIVYVMRYSSRLDYLLFNTLFLREGLRLSSFANGIYFTIYRPVPEIIRSLLSRKRGRSRAVEHEEDQHKVRQLSQGDASLFLFLRTQRLQTFWRGLWNLRHRQDEFDLVQEVVREVRNGGKEVFVVPLSLFWRKGPRTGNRFLNLDYGSLSRPSDLAKVASFLLTYRSLSVKIGEPIDLAHYMAEHRDDGQERVARTVRRSILIYLYRAEKVVEGPTLRSAQRVLGDIMADKGVQAAIRERAMEKRGSVEKAEKDVAKAYREIAARMNSTLLAALSLAVGVLIRRLFSSVETRGLDKVADYAKRHPLVLVPNHRSYFDFLIVSLLFYNSYLVPPHIAARENMAFGPFGLIFRMAGAFYLRRSFDDPLYKQVFRAYVAYLVREGFTQEFFIEGGRSRTGKTMKPRLGMLSWDLDAFLECSRRDLFFVPIALTYERLVEEGGMVDELEGGKKSKESTLALFRARKFLKKRFGSVHVSFGEPISLADALGDRRQEFESLVRSELPAEMSARGEAALLEGTVERIEEEKRVFIEGLGHRLVERINWSVIVNATSVASAALMGTAHTGLLRSDLVIRMRQLVDLLLLGQAEITRALRADQGSFEESIAFMIRGDLAKSAPDSKGEIIYFEPSKRRALDIYRNSIVHYLGVPSILARSLRAGATSKDLFEDALVWRELLYREYFTPSEEAGEAAVVRWLGFFEASGWIEQEGEAVRVTPGGEAILTCLDLQTRGVVECYEATCRVVIDAGGEISRDEVIERGSSLLENAQLLGLSGHPEAANEASFTNALELLVARGGLARKDEMQGASKAEYAPGEAWSSLGDLHELLARLAAGR
ncbi:MAG: 1-acyl-sn-glycerol-3-phosphate acyltransferase [Myxococcota bacterium]|nr:1-acyl-sn-glycerol-3-phosphate acyltransferase [Myxococcota bacterium]